MATADYVHDIRFKATPRKSAAKDGRHLGIPVRVQKRFLPLLVLYSLASPRFLANGSRWSVYRGFQEERRLVGKHSNLTGRHRADGELSSAPRESPASFETLA